ncbi:unnamed protein product [Tenebrio molitor]|nr:unnamed protein product [Tenebrio molitor]
MADFVRARNVKRYKIRHEPLNTEFKTLYRFDRDNVHALAVYFLGRDHVETRGGALSAEQKMRIFLRNMADPGFQTGIGEEVGVHQSTVSKTISDVLIRILENSNEWIKFPFTNDSINEAKQQWQERYHFPAAIGTLDCTHVRILKPSIHDDEYVNRKMFASLNVQAMKKYLQALMLRGLVLYTIQESGEIQKSVNNSVEDIIMLFCWEIVDMV